MNLDNWDAVSQEISSNQVKNHVSKIFHDGSDFNSAVETLSNRFSGEDIDAVLGIDALGFILGSAIARELETGFVPVRKGGKLPLEESELASTEVNDYSGKNKTLEVECSAIENKNVLLVDDWIETGAQMKGAVDLVESRDAKLEGIICIGVGDGNTSEYLENYRLETLKP